MVFVARSSTAGPACRVACHSENAPTPSVIAANLARAFLMGANLNHLSGKRAASRPTCCALALRDSEMGRTHVAARTRRIRWRWTFRSARRRSSPRPPRPPRRWPSSWNIAGRAARGRCPRSPTTAGLASCSRPQLPPGADAGIFARGLCASGLFSAVSASRGRACYGSIAPRLFAGPRRVSSGSSRPTSPRPRASGGSAGSASCGLRRAGYGAARLRAPGRWSPRLRAPGRWSSRLRPRAAGLRSPAGEKKQNAALARHWLRRFAASEFGRRYRRLFLPARSGRRRRISDQGGRQRCGRRSAHHSRSQSGRHLRQGSGLLRSDRQEERQWATRQASLCCIRHAGRFGLRAAVCRVETNGDGARGQLRVSEARVVLSTRNTRLKPRTRA